MSSPQTRISEFLRQYKMGSGQHPQDIYSVYKDVKAEPASLTTADLARLAEFVGQVKHIVKVTDHSNPVTVRKALDDVEFFLDQMEDEI